MTVSVLQRKEIEEKEVHQDHQVLQEKRFVLLISKLKRLITKPFGASFV